MIYYPNHFLALLREMTLTFNALANKEQVSKV